MIECRRLSKRFNQKTEQEIIALDEVDLCLREKELSVLKGASGSGKSTLLALIAALAKPSQGEVAIGGRHISKLPEQFAAKFRQEHIGFIFQKYNLIPTLSVKNNILLPLIPTNPDPKSLEQKLDKILEQFHIKDKKQRLVRELSGGEQQRVAIARALINDPQIIIADEPTANLDKKLSLDFIKILKDLRTKDKTILVATHDTLFFDLDFVDRFIELEHGKVKDDTHP